MPDPAAGRQRELDGKVEGLARQIAEVINSAGAGDRQDLREYALELLKEETATVDSPVPAAPGRADAATSPLGIALLLAVVAFPLLFLFFPVGLAMLALAAVLGVWGVLSVMLRR